MLQFKTKLIEIPKHSNHRYMLFVQIMTRPFSLLQEKGSRVGEGTRALPHSSSPSSSLLGFMCPWGLSPSHSHTGVSCRTGRGYHILISPFKSPRGLEISGGHVGLQRISATSKAGDGGAPVAFMDMAFPHPQRKVQPIPSHCHQPAPVKSTNE